MGARERAAAQARVMDECALFDKLGYRSQMRFLSWRT
jgi:hypothetical protein